MNVSAPTPDFDAPEEHQLADDIARAMHDRPLLSRLARVEEKHGGGEAFIAEAATQYAPEPQPPPEPATLLPEIDLRSLGEVLDDLHDVPAPPPSTDWLANARRAHRQSQVRQAVAWATTLGIALAIIGLALLVLRV